MAVKYVVDDSGSGRRIGEDLNAIVREATPNVNPVSSLRKPGEFEYESRIIQVKASILQRIENPIKEYFEVAVHSYLDVFVPADEASWMVADFLVEQGYEVEDMKVTR